MAAKCLQNAGWRSSDLAAVVGSRNSETAWLLMLNRPCVWASKRDLEAATKACARGQPNETGGLILGYWASKSEAVVQEITFAGPEAIGGAYSFDPDYEHDAELVAERYANSDGITTYLGDWHSHPNTMNAYLSKKDRAVLKRIAQSPDARAPRPLAMVLAGVDSYWKLKVWFGELRPALLGWQRLRVEECDIQLF